VGINFFNDLLQSLDALLGEAHRFDHFLQSDLMRGVIELLLLQSAQISHRPAPLTWVHTAMFEHEGTYLLPMNPKCLDRSRSSTNKIAHSFMSLVGDQYCRELAGPQ
jgi:hypothetical protein